MNPHEQNWIDLDAARDRMRSQLTESYREYHERRRKVRSALPVLGSALIAIVGAVGWYRMQSQTRVSNLEPIAIHQQETTEVHSSNPRTNESGDEENALNPARYQHMQLKVLSEEELPSALVQSESDWFLVTINGEPQAFSHRALESQSRNPRSVKN